MSSQFSGVTFAFCILHFAFSIAASADDPSARLAVLDAQRSAAKAARPELPDDFGPADGGSPNTDVGTLPASKSSTALRVEAAASLLGTLRETLGATGTLRLDPSEPIVLRRPEATLTLQPGTTITYRLTDASGVLEFSPPRPKLEARVFGLRVSPDLSRLDLAPDNSGHATVTAAGLRVTKRFKLDWDDGLGASQELSASPRLRVSPSIVFVTAATNWCRACQIEKPRFDALRTDQRFTWSEIKTDSLPHKVEFEGETYIIHALPTYLFRGPTGIVHAAHSWDSVQATRGVR